MVLYGPPSQVTYTRVGPSRFLQFVLEASSSWAFHRRWPHKQTSRHIIMSTHRWIDMYAIYATYAYAHITCMNTYSLKGTCMVVMYLECSNDMIFLKSCSAMFSHCMCMVSISRHIESMPVFVCMRLPNRFDEHNLCTVQYISKCLNMQETIRTISSLPWQGEGCTLTMCGEKTDLKRRVWVFVCVATCWQAAEQYKAAMLIFAQNTKTHQTTANKGTGEVPHSYYFAVLFFSFPFLGLGRLLAGGEC